jgi:phosphate starvation-inducible PhoH-like protein
MTEKVIQLEGIDPIELYGSGNSNIGRISSKFPKLKVIARGSAIKVMGDANEIDRFDRKLTELIDYFSRYGHLSGEVIDQIYDGGMPNHDELPDQETIVYGNNGVVVRARTVNQQRLVKLYERNDLLFAVGPAGSGKTYTAIALAVRALRNKEVKRIILTRPAVEAGEKLGFLPGDMKEKLDPYLQPLYDALDDMIPPAKLHKYLEEGTVQIAPLAFMRGRTLDNAFVILDEAQNTTLSQIKMFLTRMGRSARFIVTGDLTQIDLAKKSDSGLSTVMKMLRGSMASVWWNLTTGISSATDWSNTSSRHSTNRPKFWNRNCFPMRQPLQTPTTIQSTAMQQIPHQQRMTPKACPLQELSLCLLQVMLPPQNRIPGP